MNTNLGEQVDASQALSILFNNPIVSKNYEKMNIWVPNDLLEFKPEVDGKIKINGAAEIVFMPLNGFSPETKYTVKLKKKALKNLINYSAETKKGLELKSMTFNTSSLKVETARFYWNINPQNNKKQLNVAVEFNYPLKPLDVSQRMKIFINSASYKVKNSSEKFIKNIIFNIPSVKIPKENTTVKIKILKGLLFANSKNTSASDLNFESGLSSPLILEIISAKNIWEKENGKIEVLCNQAINLVSIKSNLKIKPSIKYTLKSVDGGFNILGDFKENTQYKITIKKGMRGLLGGTLKKEFTQDISMGKIPSSISFANKGAIYLSSKGAKNIGINISNVDEVELTVYKIFNNNILAYYHNNAYNNYDYYGDNYFESRNFYEDGRERYSSKIIDKVIETSTLPKVGNLRVLNINFNELKEYKGIYFIQLRSKNDYYLKTKTVVSLSDIGLMVKKSKNHMYVFANSILDNKPMSGVEISLFSKNNQKLISAKTDGEGLAILDNTDEKEENFNFYMISAQKNGDNNYLMLNDNRVDASQYETGGVRTNNANYFCYIYGERELYRPGEDVNFNVILRDKEMGNIHNQLFKIALVNPRGKEIEVQKKKVDKDGAIQFSYTTSKGAATGFYRLNVYALNGSQISSKSVSIEEFMPDKIKVKATLKSEDIGIGKNIVVNGQANNLFGPPAANKNYEVEYFINKTYFNPEGFSEYTFSNTRKFERKNKLYKGKTDVKGQFTNEYKIPKEWKNNGMLTTEIHTTVFDESGRPVNTFMRKKLPTQNTFYGINTENYYLDVHRNARFKFVALNPAGKHKKSRAQVEFYKYEYQTVYERSSRNRIRSERKERLVKKENISFNGQVKTLNFNPPSSGEYKVKIHTKGDDNVSEYSFYAYGWGYTNNQSFKVKTDGEIGIVMDKEKYNLGEKAKALFKTPFNGRLLITLERDNVISHTFIETKDRAASYTFNLDKDHIPNVYISATLIKSMGKNQAPLTVAHGYKSISVKDKSTFIPVEIMCKTESRSNKRQKITVKTPGYGNAKVTLAIVDEGILQIKKTASPNPFGYFYAKRALGVKSYDLYAKLFPELSKKMHRGGGAAKSIEMDGRSNPMANKRVKPMAIWSGVLKTNRSGTTTFDLDIPQFYGQLRIMAVAYKGKAFGSSDKEMKVVDPVVVSTTLPRFLSPNDKIDLNVNIWNTKKTATNADINIKVNNGVKVIGENNGQISLKSKEENRKNFQLKANSDIGTATVEVTVKAHGETFVSKTDISIRPPSSIISSTQSGLLLAGNSVQINTEGDYFPGSAKTTLLVSKSPFVQFIDKFKYLLGYPHGCVEQTISKAFPQLYFEDILSQIDSKTIQLIDKELDDRNAKYNVEQAVLKLQSMQLYNGGLSYWQGGNYVSEHGSIYALHFLSEAKEKGYQVSTDLLKRLRIYVKNYINKNKMENYNYWRNNTWYKEKQINRNTVYGAYVLAKINKPDRAIINYLRAKKNQLSEDSKYMLAMTYKLIGDNKNYNLLNPNYTGSNKLRRETGGSFSSNLKNSAMLLSTLLDADKNNPKVLTMVKLLTKHLKNTSYVNTNEAAWSFMALGKYAALHKNKSSRGNIIVNGKTTAFNGTDINLKNLYNKEVFINAKDKGQLYYFASTSGIPTSGVLPNKDNGISVRKTFYNRNGSKVSFNNIKQNDLIVVELSLTSLNGIPLKNVVITDMLPAGFEIENPRLSNNKRYTWAKRTNPEYMDVRDDRINLFTNLYRKSKFYYIVRAVSPGTFTMGAVQAEAMYSPDINSTFGAGTVTVKQ